MKYSKEYIGTVCRKLECVFTKFTESLKILNEQQNQYKLSFLWLSSSSKIVKTGSEIHTLELLSFLPQLKQAGLIPLNPIGFPFVSPNVNFLNNSDFILDLLRRDLLPWRGLNDDRFVISLPRRKSLPRENVSLSDRLNADFCGFSDKSFRQYTFTVKLLERSNDEQILTDRQALIIENAILKERIALLNAEIEKLWAALTSLMQYVLLIVLPKHTGLYVLKPVSYATFKIMLRIFLLT